MARQAWVNSRQGTDGRFYLPSRRSTDLQLGETVDGIANMENLNSADWAGQAGANRAHVIAVTSGKGGVGKTCIATNVAAAMAARGARVCIFDADTGLANINILLGLRPTFTLEHVLRGDKSIHDIIFNTDEGIAVVPGASGIADAANLDAEQARKLAAALAELEAEYDYFLIDTAAGVADSVLQFIDSAPCAFLVITSEPTSLTDAFALLKLLQARNYAGRLRIVVNQAIDYPGAADTYRRFSSAVDKHLGLKVEYGGFVVRDDNVPKSVALQVPVVNLQADCPASRCLSALADNVLKYIGPEDVESGLANYWANLLTEKQNGDAEAVVPSQPQPGVQMPAGTQPSIDEAVAKLLAAIKNQPLEREKLESFFDQFVAEFVERCGCFPSSFRQLLFRWLESENHAAPRLLELIATLEALFTARYQQPLFSLEDSSARLVAQCRGDAQRFGELLHQLHAAYRQAFHAEFFDAQAEILNNIQQDDFTEEQFEKMLRRQLDAFQSRFKRPYQGQSELLLESTAEALSAMEQEEQKLKQQLSALNSDFQQLAARRDALLAAIKRGQSGTVAYEAPPVIGS